ncbi:hypothetical protein ES708_26095 [subsurface metagenome]
MVDRIKVSELLLDYELYPRERIEPFNVTQMVEALKAGRELPPIVVDRKSHRVVDGFHRLRAYQKLYGLDAEIPVEVRDYKDDAQMFADAVRLNANHGRQLSTYDRARCIARAESLKLEPAVISSILNMTLERIADMKVERFATYKMEPRVLKRTTAHLAGKELTDDEAEYNIKAGGMHQTFYINQVIAMLEADTANWENQKVGNALKKLCDLLDKAFMVRAGRD